MADIRPLAIAPHPESCPGQPCYRVDAYFHPAYSLSTKTTCRDCAELSKQARAERGGPFGGGPLPSVVDAEIPRQEGFKGLRRLGSPASIGFPALLVGSGADERVVRSGRFF